MTAAALLKESRKAILGFLAVFVAQLVENLVSSDGTALLPQSTGEWITLLGTAFGGAAAVFLVPNRLNEKQVAKGLDELPPEATQRVIQQSGVTPPAGEPEGS